MVPVKNMSINSIPKAHATTAGHRKSAFGTRGTFEKMQFQKANPTKSTAAKQKFKMTATLFQG